MGDAFHEAFLDLQHKQEIWRTAQMQSTHVRTSGDEIAVVVQGIADRLKASGSRDLSAEEIQVLKDLEDAKAARTLATDAERSARDSLIGAERTYKKLELAWAESGLSRFYACWLLSRAAAEARRG